MAMNVEGIFLIGQHLTNIDSVHKKLEKELRSLKLESHTKELHIETLLNKNAVSLALIKYLLHGIFLMFERKETLSYDETIQLIELAKLDTATYKEELIKNHKDGRKSEDKTISELEISHLAGRTRVDLLFNFISVMSQKKFSQFTQEVYLDTAENNITEVNKYMSFYSEKILKEYYGISY